MQPTFVKTEKNTERERERERETSTHGYQCVRFAVQQTVHNFITHLLDTRDIRHGAGRNTSAIQICLPCCQRQYCQYFSSSTAVVISELAAVLLEKIQLSTP